MCRCTPEMRTMFCGRGDCVSPGQVAPADSRELAQPVPAAANNPLPPAEGAAVRVPVNMLGIAFIVPQAGAGRGHVHLKSAAQAIMLAADQPGARGAMAPGRYELLLRRLGD